MKRNKTECLVLGDWIAGEFKKPKELSGQRLAKSPADWSDVIGQFDFSYSSVHEAVDAARSAFPKWKKSLLEERVRFIQAYQKVLKKYENLWVEAIAREVGKPLWEAKTEFSSVMNKIDITLQESLKFVSDIQVPQILENTYGVCRYRPLGVMAVIGPFNFPAHLPLGHIIPALLTGNTLVFKPSEKTPWLGQLIAQCFEEAQFPPGVFNMIQGDKEVGRRLCVHEGVDGVLFTGSYEVGEQLKQETLHQHWKLLVLEMGGKNSAIVWEDANLEIAVYETLLAGFLTAGQRCSSTSRILVQRKILGSFIELFHAKAKAFSIAHPFDQPFMGPLIDQAAVDRYMKFLGIAQREGCEVLMRGKVLELQEAGNYVTPSICLTHNCSLEQTQKSIYQQTELFAPNVLILAVDEVEEALDQANATQYGLVASVFTSKASLYHRFREDLNVGLVNWNKASVGASSRLPFGGLKKSGNHFPTALTASLYCTAAISSLEVAEPILKSELIPGLNWNDAAQPS